MILFKKAIRSILVNKKAYISCIILMAIGTISFVSLNCSTNAINSSKNSYYSSNNLGDAFATVTKIPSSALQALHNIKGIKTVEARISNVYRVEIPNNKTDDVTLQLISTKIGAKDLLNSYEYKGYNLKNPDDILLGEDFYNAHNYSPNDKIRLIIDGASQTFNVTGSCTSPQYVMIAKSADQLISDTTKYNIAYIDEKTYMNLTGMNDCYNDLSFAFDDGVKFDDVKNQIQYILNKYGLISLVERKNLTSYVMLDTKMKSTESMSTTMPMAFVIMASIVLYLMLKRIIEQDRSQIGMMKAFGYSDNSILFHYMIYGLVTGVSGAVFGDIIGYFGAISLTNMYLSFYKLPLISMFPTYSYFITGGLISIVGGCVGTYFGARGVILLSPADSMRPPSPKYIKSDIMQTFPFLFLFVNNRGVMAIRNISRNKLRSFFIAMGITFSFGIIALMGIYFGIFDKMFFNQFTKDLKYDGEITLAKSVPYSVAVNDTLSINGITYAEGVLKTPVEIYNGFMSTRVTVVGLKNDNYLYKIFDDTKMENISLTKNQMVLGSIVANSIHVKSGDYVYLKSPIFKQDQKIYISKIVNQSIGTSGYMDLDSLCALENQPQVVNSIVFNATNAGMINIREKLFNSKNVLDVTDKQQVLQNYHKLFDSYSYTIQMVQFLGAIIAFVIIYNTAVISMSERSREYATLRIMGMSENEVCEIMNFEYWILCGLGMLAGVPFALLLNSAIQGMMANVKGMSIPPTIPLIGYVIAFVGCVFAVLFSNITSAKAIKKLDLIEVLKERD